MIESCGRPILGGVTGPALIAKSSRMCIILFMTGDTVHGRANKDSVDMAALASDCGVFSIQFECKFRMIDRPVPSIRNVT